MKWKIPPKRNRLLLLLVLAISVTTCIVVFVYWFVFIEPLYSTVEFGIDVQIDSVAGVYVGDDAIHFGKLTPGSSAMKQMTVTADDSMTSVAIELSGNISEWVMVSDNDFILEPHEKKIVEVSIIVPEDAELHKSYEGTLRVVQRRL